MVSTRLALFACALAALATPLLAQGTPSGQISGRVLDPDGLALPGVAVTAESPALQGVRSAVSSSNGDYIIPFLPAGDYKVTFGLSGFAELAQRIRVANAASVSLDARLNVAAMNESIEVTATGPSDFGPQAEAATGYQSDLMVKLPTGRTILAATDLAPGVHATGSGGNVTISGASSFENVFMINGVTAQDNIRNTPLNLFIEDAIQETTIITSGVSAEYGRFSGGVVNAITKSGGNRFAGSFRTTFTNDDWVALTDYPNDSRVDDVVPTYEATLGGPILKDRLWFFGAYRGTDNKSSRTTTEPTNLNYEFGEKESRYEGKLTWSATRNHTFKGAYTRIERTETNASFARILDLDSLYDRELPQQLLSLNYTGVLTPQLFVDVNIAAREFSFVGSGSRFTDLTDGTVLLDRARRGSRYHAPTFCGVCDDEERDNREYVVKANYFLSTGSLGSHNLAAGVDVFEDLRFANNHQSGSDYLIFGTSTRIVDGIIYPVFNNDGSTFIRWAPIFESSQGSNFRTTSVFLNDSWRWSNRLSFNLGLRYDRNDGQDSMGNTVVRDSAWSPRLGVTFDPRGDGEWTIHASYGTYVTAIGTAVGDSASAGGQPATLDFDYRGPAINVGGAATVGQDDAVDTVFEWFFANGGKSRPTREAPFIPGVTSVISEGLSSPHANELSAGFSRRLGTRGLLRVDGVYREYKDFYSSRTDLSTGRVQDPLGRSFDLAITENTNEPERTYRGLNLQLSYPLLDDRLLVGGNYTLSRSRGNFSGENAFVSVIESYPEYSDRAWSAPVGDLSIDQRHRGRVWATYDVPLPEAVGRLDIGLLELMGSGTPYGGMGQVSTRPYVSNPGYLTPPATVPYFFTAPDEHRTKALFRTDLALNYAHEVFERAEIFGRFRMLNVFDRQEPIDANHISAAVLMRGDKPSLQAFDPFVTTPVEGTHWRRASTFGQPSSRLAYGTPRTFDFSIGLRF
jgi:hypothetical protein